jgi:hypothetical protein
MENYYKINSICQCCLDDDPPMKNMLTETYQDTPLIENFKICSGIDLLKEDQPKETCKNICQKCETNLKISIEFRELCQTSQQMLTERLSFIGVVKAEPISDEDEPLVLYTKRGTTRSATMLTQVFLRSQSESDSKVTAPCPKIEEVIPTEPVIEPEVTPEVQDEPISNDVDVDDKIFDNDDFFAGQDSTSESEIEDYSPPIKLAKTEKTETSDLNEEIFNMPALFMCYHCDELVHTFKGYLVHQKRHEEVINLNAKIKRNCYVCKEDVTNYILHLKEQHKDFKPNTCQQCEKKFHKQIYLKAHLHHHTDSTPFKCLGCKMFFSKFVCET